MKGDAHERRDKYGVDFVLAGHDRTSMKGDAHERRDRVAKTWSLTGGFPGACEDSFF